MKRKQRNRIAVAFVVGVLAGIAGMVVPYLKALQEVKEGDAAYESLYTYWNFPETRTHCHHHR